MERIEADLEAQECKKKLEIPIYHKQNLTLEEAAVYSNIGINRLDILTKRPDCDFVLKVGAKRLIKRRLFDEYIEKTSMI